MGNAMEIPWFRAESQVMPSFESTSSYGFGDLGELDDSFGDGETPEIGWFKIFF